MHLGTTSSPCWTGYGASLEKTKVSPSRSAGLVASVLVACLTVCCVLITEGVGAHNSVVGADQGFRAACQDRGPQHRRGRLEILLRRLQVAASVVSASPAGAGLVMSPDSRSVS